LAIGLAAMLVAAVSRSSRFGSNELRTVLGLSVAFALLTWPVLALSPEPSGGIGSSLGLSSLRCGATFTLGAAAGQSIRARLLAMLESPPIAAGSSPGRAS